jgi:serine/threonine protein kinase
LFGGQNSEQQFLKIMNIMGSPSREELQDMQIPDIPKLPLVRGKGLESVLGKVDPLFIDLLKCLLNYSPAKRTKSFALLAHPFFDSLREHQVLVENSPIANLFDFNETEVGEDRAILSKLQPKWQ